MSNFDALYSKILWKIEQEVENNPNTYDSRTHASGGNKIIYDT